MTTWRYNINPQSPEAYEYLWNLDDSESMLKSADRTWPMWNKFNKVNVGDEIAVYLKNIGGGQPDAIRVIGNVVSVDRASKEFTWEPNAKRTRMALANPMLKDEQESYFGRAFGSAMLALPAGRQARWDKRFGGKPKAPVKPMAEGRTPTRKNGAAVTNGWGNPLVSKENGLKGELHVVARLKREFPAAKGFSVVHVAAAAPTADHDIEVHKGKKVVLMVEVKTRVDVKCAAPVLISQNELSCRKAAKGKHRITVVYLGAKGQVIRCRDINELDEFTLSPRQYCLTPEAPQ